MIPTEKDISRTVSSAHAAYHITLALVLLFALSGFFVGQFEMARRVLSGLVTVAVCLRIVNMALTGGLHFRRIRSGKECLCWFCHEAASSAERVLKMERDK